MFPYNIIQQIPNKKYYNIKVVGIIYRHEYICLHKHTHTHICTHTYIYFCTVSSSSQNYCSREPNRLKNDILINNLQHSRSICFYVKLLFHKTIHSHNQRSMSSFGVDSYHRLFWLYNRHWNINFYISFWSHMQ